MLNKTYLNVLGVLLLLAGFAVNAAIDVYQFNSDSDRDRFRQLTTELRCPKCQNQNIADSNAPIAQDLRTKIQAMLSEKKSDQQIVDYMIERYGDFVLYQPRVDSKTYILWFGPAVLLLLGIIVVVFISRRNTAKVNADAVADTLATHALDAEQQKQIETLLNGTGKHSS
ncbi:MAG: cytochrome c-type biogenesis protein CcmH [Methylococcales bacterium]|nr:cytochrome c-type biogenesis protein CcmH [Methylococcales bacterium]